MQLAARFSRYVQYRDGGWERNRADDADSFTRYAADRDRARPEGRLFDAEHTVGDAERRQLVGYIRQTTRHDRALAGGQQPGRAFYRMVISPEDARGVDLRQVTRETMRQLEKDVGKLPPWIAAEHRNTEHPHVHVIMAARVRTKDSARTVMITKPRLERMKTAMGSELSRQHDRSHALGRGRGPDLRTAAQISPAPGDPVSRMVRGDQRLSRGLGRGALDVGRGAFSLFGSIAKEFSRQMQLQAIEQARRERELQEERHRGRGRGD
ncbi:MAG: hypothetical protein QOE92_495 [Chloroflexota bacterium]|nr:hypothetical protein [Chloroflexota bacterium]